MPNRPGRSKGDAIHRTVNASGLGRKLDASQGFRSQDCGNLTHRESREYFREFLAGVCARTQPAGHSGDSPSGNARWVGAARCCGGATALVVDRAGARCFVCAGVDLPLLCGAQPASHIRTSVVVLVGRSKDGSADTYGKDGRGSSPLHGGKLEHRKREIQNSAQTRLRCYSVRMARISLPRTRISTPRGGRKSEPCTIAPRTKKFPGRFVILSGSKSVPLQGLPTMGCFAALKP